MVRDPGWPPTTPGRHVLTRPRVSDGLARRGARASTECHCEIVVMHPDNLNGHYFHPDTLNLEQKLQERQSGQPRTGPKKQRKRVLHTEPAPRCRFVQRLQTAWGSASANPPPAPLTRLIPGSISLAWEEIFFTFCTQSSRLQEMRLRKTPTAYKKITRAAINNVTTTTGKTIRIISHPFPIGFRKLDHGRVSR